MSDSGASVTPYAGNPLDRASQHRRDAGWLRDRLANPRTEVIPLWRDRCLVAADLVIRLTGIGVQGLPQGAGEPVFLGMRSDVPVFGVDLSALPQAVALEAAGADRVVDVRHLVTGLEPAEAAVLGYARGICYWHRHQGFCGTCGGPTRSIDGGAARQCTKCDQLIFPRISPAVIMLVAAPDGPDRCLMARHAGADDDSFSLLAGFVEVGESLEDAVRREVAEEAGVLVDSVRYFASQPWPFPAGLMVGFYARATSTRTVVDGEELVETRWFTRADLRARRASRGCLGNLDSIDRMLLEAWLEARDELEPTG